MVDLFDWFMITEYDLPFTADQLRRIVDGFDAFQGTNYVPGLLRYEALSELFLPRGRSGRGRNGGILDMYLTEFALPKDARIESKELRINRLVYISGRIYMSPEQPYQAFALLPRAHVSRVFAKLKATTQIRICHKSSVRREASSFWFLGDHAYFNGEGDMSKTWMKDRNESGLHTEKLIPIDSITSFHAHLIITSHER